MRIAFFDFDDTLFHTPFEKEGKTEWEKKTGRIFPKVPPGYEDFSDYWWKSTHSLDTSIFNIEPNEWVLQQWLECKERGDYLIMMTGRIEPLKDQVMEILKSNSLEFDEVYFKPVGGQTLSYKIKTMESRISELQPTEVIFYDDREEHHQKFIDWAKSRKDINITIINAITHQAVNNWSNILPFNEFLISSFNR